MVSLITYTIIALLLSAFFSGMEIAFISSNKLRIELLNKEGKIGGRLLSKHIRYPERFIATTLLANNITLVVFAITFAKILLNLLPDYIIQTSGLLLIVQTVISTGLVLTVGEFLPKLLFQMKSVKMLTALIPLFDLFYYPLYPVVRFFMWLSNQLINLVVKETPSVSKRLIFGSSDLDNLLKGTDQKHFEEELNVDPKFLENAIDLHDVKVRECMVPRTEISAIDINESIENLRSLFVETRHSRLLVFEDSIENIVGYVHHFELLDDPNNIKSILIPIMLIPESMNASELLDVFIEKHKGIAWVVDEFGGTAGMITLEDVLEEIIGEIEDEYDDEDLLDKQISADEFLFSARLEIDYINDKYKINLPVGDYETLGGLIISSSESIPRKSQKVYIPHFEFTILASSQNKIDKVKLYRIYSKE